MATPAPHPTAITFADLFAGIGGFHLALHSLGARCVFVSEWDENARKTYQTNFQKISPELFAQKPPNTTFAGDITKINEHNIPDFDILTAGFPCQPFSQAGLKKGFTETRGTLFFDIARIIKAKRPAAFFLENVRGLLHHDNGKTFTKIQHVLTKELGYSFHHKVIFASDFGLPQHRPRLFMVGFKNPATNFQFPKPQPLNLTMSDIFGGQANKKIGYTLRVGGRGSKLGDRRNWEFYLVDGKIRRIGIPEAKKMQGFPDDFTFPVPETQAMKQLGNSVAVPAIRATATQIIKSLNEGAK